MGHTGDRGRRPPVEPGGGGFARRWSRRKRAARSGEEASAEALPAVLEEAPAGALDAPAEPAPVVELTDADMPPLDSLDEDSDYAGFLSPKVSEELRRAALRKLFSSALFNRVDGLDDYDEDFSSFEPLLEMTRGRRLPGTAPGSADAPAPGAPEATDHAPPAGDVAVGDEGTEAAPLASAEAVDEGAEPAPPRASAERPARPDAGGGEREDV